VSRCSGCMVKQEMLKDGHKEVTLMRERLLTTVWSSRVVGHCVLIGEWGQVQPIANESSHTI
jgi:hypothetical protein